MSLIWKTTDGVNYYKGSEDTDLLAVFGYEGTLEIKNNFNPKAVSLFKILNNKGFQIIIISNQGRYSVNKITPIGHNRPGEINELSFRSQVESFLKYVNVPFDFYYTTDTTKHKPNTFMWSILNKRNYRRESFYLGAHSGRPQELTDDDVRFATAIGLQFKHLEFMDYYGFLNQLNSMATTKPTKRYENVIVSNNTDLLESERVKLTGDVQKILQEERSKLAFENKEIINKLQKTIIDLESKLADATANLNGSKLVIAELQMKLNKQKSVTFSDTVIEPSATTVIADDIFKARIDELVADNAPIEEYTPINDILKANATIEEPFIAIVTNDEHSIAIVANEEPSIATAINDEHSIANAPIEEPSITTAANDDIFKAPIEEPIVANDERPTHTHIKITANCEFEATDNELVVLYVAPGAFRDAIVEALKDNYKLIKKASEIKPVGRFMAFTDEPYDGLVRYLVFEIDKAKVLENSPAVQKKSINDYYKNFKMPAEKNGNEIHKFKF
jgi:histidinol phosphatase-like enzyme